MYASGYRRVPIGEWTMANFLCLRGGLRILAMLVPFSMTVGCHEPLALQDRYFVPGEATDASRSWEALHVVRYNRALQTARQSCLDAAPAVATTPAGPDETAVADRQAALARLCAAAPTSSRTFHGSIANAYRRWVEDQTRTLPEASATAAGAAGGS